MIPTNYCITEQQKKEERRDRIRVRIFVLIIAAVVAFILFEGFGTVRMMRLFMSEAEAEGIQEECWILCRPGSYVSLREKPGKRAAEFGGALCGAKMWTDGTTRNGYLRVTEIAAEQDHGWVSARYVVYSEPREINCPLRIRSEGRVAVRKWIGGKIVKWMRDGDEILVYAMSDEWAVTEKGYIMTAFLEVPQG